MMVINDPINHGIEPNVYHKQYGLINIPAINVIKPVKHKNINNAILRQNDFDNDVNWKLSRKYNK